MFGGHNSPVLSDRRCAILTACPGVTHLDSPRYDAVIRNIAARLVMLSPVNRAFASGITGLPSPLHSGTRSSATQRLSEQARGDRLLAIFYPHGHLVSHTARLVLAG